MNHTHHYVFSSINLIHIPDTSVAYRCECGDVKHRTRKGKLTYDEVRTAYPTIDSEPPSKWWKFW